ncbi:MAG: hypothetical protein JNK82_18335 [Myxococcaceae bacterium]|nr:hypothetical protein [Myxococcaceae bacterium]
MTSGLAPFGKVACPLFLLLSAAAAAEEEELEDGGHHHPYFDAGVQFALADTPWLTFQGQKVLPEEVYRTILRLPPDAGVDVDTAHSVRVQLTDFLHTAGYELAHVDVSIGTDGGMTAQIDEGALEKVVFKGRLNVQTVRFKLALDLPHDVFNRPDLERQVKKLEQQLGLQDIRLVLIPSTVMKHVGPQLESVPEVKGFEIFHELRAYELHIVLPDREWDTGLGLDVRTGYIDGLELQGKYFGRSGLFIDDRWSLIASVAGGLRRHIITDNFYPHFSRVGFDGKYFFPALSGNLRFAPQVQASLVSRIRKDLNLADYFASEVSGALWLEWEPRRGIRLSFGGGFLDRRIFWLTGTGDPELPLAPGAVPSAGSRPFGALNLDFTFDPENDRWDRRHILQVYLQQQFPGIGAGPFARAQLYYRYVQPFGWHDFWLRSGAYVVWYESQFHDEASLGEFLHGAFGQDFVRRAANINTEFRFSVTRDLLKISVQSDLAIYTAVDRTRDQGPLQFASSFGPGLHILLEGMFQLDMYLTIGLRPRGVIDDAGKRGVTFDTSVGFSANLLKAY